MDGKSFAAQLMGHANNHAHGHARDGVLSALAPGRGGGTGTVATVAAVATVAGTGNGAGARNGASAVAGRGGGLGRTSNSNSTSSNSTGLRAEYLLEFAALTNWPNAEAPVGHCPGGKCARLNDCPNNTYRGLRIVTSEDYMGLGLGGNLLFTEFTSADDWWCVRHDQAPNRTTDDKTTKLNVRGVSLNPFASPHVQCQGPAWHVRAAGQTTLTGPPLTQTQLLTQRNGLVVVIERYEAINFRSLFDLDKECKTK